MGAGKRWNAFSVDIEFYDDGELFEATTATINRAKTNIVEVSWTPQSGGTHSISIIVDPEDEIIETNENNNEGQKSVEVGGSSNNTPGFEVPFVILALAILVILNILRFKRKR